MHGTPESSPSAITLSCFPMAYTSNPDPARMETRGKLAAEWKVSAQKNTTGVTAETATETTPPVSILKWTKERKGGRQQTGAGGYLTCLTYAKPFPSGQGEPCCFPLLLLLSQLAPWPPGICKAILACSFPLGLLVTGTLGLGYPPLICIFPSWNPPHQQFLSKWIVKTKPFQRAEE